MYKEDPQMTGSLLSWNLSQDVCVSFFRRCLTSRPDYNDSGKCLSFDSASIYKPELVFCHPVVLTDSDTGLVEIHVYTSNRT